MLGDQIDRRRRELGLSQRELAQKSGLSPQYISYLISGKRGQRLSVTAATGLAKALRVSKKFLQGESTYVDSPSEKSVTGAS
ncbi:XRE family transcriptional regulator [Deinococcus aerius]|uniref:XRE family transcriptional regulator n=1 Tax=Deinococcus aerius TaxID=200253 RepID=A0A2I9DLM5_9DEIO|nr:helix-turn-helix transcriptional regulator [Deinococcus aerius]GBF05881.1 XRE family transcriptional regulator [Deinococcus aerius]